MRKSEEKTLQLSRETLKNLDQDPVLLKKLAGGICLTSLDQTTCTQCHISADC